MYSSDTFVLHLLLFIFRERGMEGGREGEKQPCERETSIGCLLYVPRLDTEHASQACALTGD